MKYNLIGCDFSLNKPALSIEIDNKLNFFFFPLEYNEKKLPLLTECGINVYNRERICKLESDSTKQMKYHLLSAISLSELIVEKIKPILNPNYKTIFSSEGLSFGSIGDASLQLSGYKYIFLSKILEICEPENILTYAPITIKKTAGCSKRGTNKLDVINSFIENGPNVLIRSKMKEQNTPLKLKVNWIPGIDDIVDSWWCLETLKQKMFG